ncbi:hypothetical protein CSPX01_15535 [Colletotrichum filicis]|nr:hypothetical protein CSPX01_15535 [Colletotrichum filicis]
MDQPKPPSDNEKQLYYYGLPSRPILVARSDSITNPWNSIERNGWVRRKCLAAVGTNHLIVRLWNDHDGPGSLTNDIVTALTRYNLDWNAIDILRVGYLEDNEADFPVTMFVSARKNCTTWRTAFEAATECRRVLGEHGVFDVHCEIKEASTQQMVSPSATPTSRPTLVTNLPDPTVSVFNINNTKWTWPYLEFGYDLTDGLGVPIATHEVPERQGTKGIYLRVKHSNNDQKSTSTVFALTCRHVCFCPDDVDDWLPENDWQQTTKRLVVQPGEPHQRKRTKDAEYHITQISKRIIGLEKSVPSHTERQKDEYSVYQKSLATLLDIQTHFSGLENLDNRVFGEVAYSRNYSLGSHGQLQDWCLIRLHQAAHQQPLDQLSNKVMLGSSSTLSRLFPFGETVHENGVLGLTSSVVPAAEIMTTVPALLVGKYGSGSQATVGVFNQVKSVRRQLAKSSEHFQSKEFCVISANASVDVQACFSVEGDSGSVVFDVDGRVVGIITAGVTRTKILEGSDDYDLDRAVDVTYVYPMEYILEDLKSCGLEAEVV